MITKIRKRDGREVPFNIEKIADAIFKAAQAVGGQNYSISLYLAEKVAQLVEEKSLDRIPSVEDIQDAVEKVLIEEGHAKTAKEYILYRSERSKVRDMNTRLMKVFEDLTYNNKANFTSMETMVKYGFESAKEFYDLFILNPEHSKAHKNGDIYIHNLEFLTLTTESCHMDLIDLLGEEEFKDIRDQAEEICFYIEANGNDQFGGQSIPNLDYLMAIGVTRTYKNQYRDNLVRSVSLLIDELNLEENLYNIFDTLYLDYGLFPKLDNNLDYLEEEKKYLGELIDNGELIEKIQKSSERNAYKYTRDMTYNALEYLVKKLNNISRISPKDLYISLSFGTDRSPEARLVSENLLLVIKNLGPKEDSPYVSKIFKIKSGINYDGIDINYDLLKKAMEISKLGLRMNYSFLDASYNVKYFRENDYKSEVSYMNSGLRLMENIYNKNKEVGVSRGNLSTTSLNLPRIAMESEGNIGKFFKILDEKINLIIAQLLERFEIQASKFIANYPILMQQGIWIDANKLKYNDEIREIIKNGSLTLGFTGLYNALEILGTEDIDKLGEEIVSHMKTRLDDISRQLNMNFSLLSTEDDKINKRFLELDKKTFKLEYLEGIDSYYSGFHKGERIDKLTRIVEEGKYYEYTNGGHNISIKLETEERKLDYIQGLLALMKKNNIGYAAIN